MTPQGWGQVVLSNVLPVPGAETFDLYVADYQEIRPMTETTYVAHVHSNKHAFRATLAWVDPPNVMYATLITIIYIIIIIIIIITITIQHKNYCCC
jgi:hypothetical protein